MATTQETYKRNQLEEAVWRSFGLGSGKKTPAKAFLTRIKRLLEIDRDSAGAPAFQGLAHAYAFFDEEPGGRGHETRFSVFNAFCLVIALKQQDFGLKQSEAVFFMKHARKAIASQYRKLDKRGYAPTSGDVLAEHYPDMPSYKNGLNTIVDWRVFMVVRRLDQSDPRLKSTDLPFDAVFVRPDFCYGVNELNDWIHGRGWSLDAALIIEIAKYAHLSAEFLSQSEARLRGAPAA